MTYYLFLDDERLPIDVTWVKLPYNVSWTIVRSYDEFIKIVEQRGIPQHVSFDHDLADEHYNPNIRSYKEKTGFDCVKWLCNYCHDNEVAFPNYTVHSMNPIGAKNIDQYVRSAKMFDFIR